MEEKRDAALKELNIEVPLRQDEEDKVTKLREYTDTRTQKAILEDLAKVRKQFGGAGKTLLSAGSPLDYKSTQWTRFCQEISETLVSLIAPTTWVFDYLKSMKSQRKSPSSTLLSTFERTATSVIKIISALDPDHFDLDENRLQGDTSISSISHGIREQQRSAGEDLPDTLLKASEILVNSDTRLAKMFSFEAFVEGFWGNAWFYEREDVSFAIWTLPHLLKDRGKFEEAAEYMRLISTNLSNHYEIFKESYDAQYFFVFVEEQVMQYWARTPKAARVRFLESLKASPITFRNGYVFAQTINNLVELDEIETCYEISTNRFNHVLEKSAESENDEETSTSAELKELWQLARKLAEMDKKQVNLILNEIKGRYLEDRVNELGSRKGYPRSENEKRQFAFKNPALGKCVKGPQVEIDALHSKAERMEGKVIPAYFVAECKYRNREAAYNSSSE